MSTQESLEVGAGRVVGIFYTVKDAKGAVIDSSRSHGSKPLAFLHGAGNVVRGIEKALEGRRRNERLEFAVPPEDGYGPARPELVEKVRRDRLPVQGELKPGMRLTGRDPEGRPVAALITAVDGNEVTLDRNHPLAGQTLTFEVTIAGVREATEEERTHGHPHGPGGHGH